MKLSKARYSLFFLVTLMMGFAIGFFTGAYPEKLIQATGQNPKVLSLIFSDEKHVPMQLLLDFEKSTGVSFSAKVISSYFVFQSEAQKADLIFVPFSWFENALPLMIDSPSLKEFNPLLSSDFISLSLSSDHFLPVFWKVSATASPDQNDLLLWGFAIGKKQTEASENSFKLISYLIQDPERMKAWIGQTGLAASLKASDAMSGIPDALKAKQLREYPLSKLTIQRQFE